MKFYYKKYHLFFYARRPLYNTYYFSIRQTMPIFWPKIDFWGGALYNNCCKKPLYNIDPLAQA